MLANTSFVHTEAFKELSNHYKSISSIHLKQMFENDPDRFSKYSLLFDDILFDYSKNRIDGKTMELLLQLAEECKVKDAIEAMFSGARINETENRSVLHTALRSSETEPLVVDGEDIRPAIRKVLEQMKQFSQRVISGEWKGYSGKEITDVVNIGIGG